ncbi:MAG: hypothetical protein LBG42_08075, partial [Treponema sp.]|nr:hypothetical protein [Treponema sp.]
MARIASKLIQPKRGRFFKTKTWPKSDRLGLFPLLTGGLFHTCLFSIYFQEPFHRLVEPGIQLYRVLPVFPPFQFRFAFLAHLCRLK